MKALTFVLTLLTICWAPPLMADEAPHEVGGFVLGGDIGAYTDRLRMDTVLPLRHQEYLKEVETAPLPGFKSGLIAFGTCAQPGRIVRIKLKYIDASRSFYDALLSRVENRFGKPSAYQGDPFHVVIEWKWSFTDDAGNRINLHLGHNNQDIEEKYGNTIKLTLVDAIDAERGCHQAAHPRERPERRYRSLPLKSMDPAEWEPLLPQ